MSTGWTAAFPLSKLPVGGGRMFTQDRDQVAVFRIDEETLYAVDNRCPHEGYPLIKGTRKGCTLTCDWHNYKFNLVDGACIKGEEAVRTFPVRVVDGTVELDLSPPDLSKAVPKLWLSLEEALLERRIGQAARDAVRLLEAGEPPTRIASFVAAFDGARGQYGANHALAVAYDILQWEERYPGTSFAVPLAQLLDLASRNNTRRPIRVLASPEDPGADPLAAGREWRVRVEAEDTAGAEALLRGALVRGWQRAELEPWFFGAVSDHFLSFGHRLIYQTKVFDLLDVSDWEYAEPILCGHLFGLVNGTREDVLPNWTEFGKSVEDLDLVGLYAGLGSNPDWHGADALLSVILDGKPADAIQALANAMQEGAPMSSLADVMVLGGAERMLRFDTDIDGNPDCQDNWLSVTHIQTFAHAVRIAAARYQEPDVLRLLFFSARFINHHKVLDLPVERRQPVVPGSEEIGDFLAAIDRRDSVGAMGVASSMIRTPEGTSALRDLLMDVVISDAISRPIVSAHAIKNLVVGLEEWTATGDDRPLLAAVRLLSGPLQQRWTYRSAREAVAFVTKGTVPKLMAP